MTSAVEIWAEFKQFWDASNQTADQLGVHQAFDSWFRRIYPSLGDPDFWTPPDFSGLIGVHTAEDPFSGHIPGNLNPHPRPRPGPQPTPIPRPWPAPVAPGTPSAPSAPRLPRGPGAFTTQPQKPLLSACQYVETLTEREAYKLNAKLESKDWEELTDYEKELAHCLVHKLH